MPSVAESLERFRERDRIGSSVGGRRIGTIPLVPDIAFLRDSAVLPIPVSIPKSPMPPLTTSLGSPPPICIAQ
jgi:hypothetical protein